MQGGNLGIIESNAAPPPLDLSPEESAALAEERVDDQAACADRSSRKAPAHGGVKSLQGLLRPIERPSSEPRALALDGGGVPAMQQGRGQDPWQDDRWLRQPWRWVEETLGAADGVDSVEGSDVPTPGAPAVGGARPWGGHVGPVDHGQAGGCAASASRTGSTRLDRRR